MKKSVIASLVALAMVVTGTGYAYWTDTLNVTTKATTGDLDVTFADLGLYAQYGNETNSGEWSIIDGIGASGYVESNAFMRGASDYNIIATQGQLDNYNKRAAGYHEVEFDAELVDMEQIKKDVGDYVAAKTQGSDNILITIDNMYPGYAQTFRTDILNVGSIAAKLSALKFTVGANGGNDINQTTKDMLGIAVLIDKEEYTGNGMHGEVFGLCDSLNLSADSFFELGGVDFVRLSALENLGTITEVIQNANLLVAPTSDNRMDLFLGVAMDPDAEGQYTTGSTAVMADNNDADSQFKGAQVSIDLLWDQFNQGVDADTTNRLENQNRQ